MRCLLPLLFAWHVASVWWLLLPVAGCVGWLGQIARHSFRADRDARISRRHVLVLTALPLQLAFFQANVISFFNFGRLRGFIAGNLDGASARMEDEEAGDNRDRNAGLRWWRGGHTDDLPRIPCANKLYVTTRCARPD